MTCTDIGSVLKGHPFKRATRTNKSNPKRQTSRGATRTDEINLEEASTRQMARGNTRQTEQLPSARPVLAIPVLGADMPFVHINHVSGLTNPR